ncbi:MAG: hypothetical protein Q7P63_02805 [Verrucomicrobiota bacterium JB022]|nr:hypothetical protein [Verrucomicrobiota bacterium JB022]
MFRTSWVLGFHGCDRAVGERVLAGEHLQLSRNDYDWLGEGIYFWENDPLRAYHWALFIQQHPQFFKTRIDKPFVVGAIIDPGSCLDLSDQSSLTTLQRAYEVFREIRKMEGGELPENKSGFEGDADLIKRHLDCAVINFMHYFRQEEGLEPYTTVRGPFMEGEPLYPGAKIMAKTHVQITVRDPVAIRGYFRVAEL